jgi:hypothetical protein
MFSAVADINALAVKISRTQRVTLLAVFIHLVRKFAAFRSY